jgi:hypothetical protein
MIVDRPRVRMYVLALVGALLTSMTGCEGTNSSENDGTGSTATTPSLEPDNLLPAGGPPYAIDGNGFDPANFGPDSADVDNIYFPLVPGSQFVYEGSSIGDEGERLEHSVVFTVTGLTKEIAGVRAVVGWDRDFEEGALVEKELIFFAQDLDGNVWHLGQYAELYDGKQFEGAAPWLVGYVDGASAGIAMQAEHQEGDAEYSQGYAPPPYYWDDYGRVFKTGQRTCVPAGCYDDVLVTEEFEPLKPGAYQLKFYAPGVGYVRVGWRGAKEREREVLVLSEVRQLDADDMEKVHIEAFAMQDRGNVYGMTAPLEVRT